MMCSVRIMFEGETWEDWTAQKETTTTTKLDSKMMLTEQMDTKCVVQLRYIKNFN